VVGFFGEREHIQLVLVFPYLTLASLRAAGHNPSRRLVILCGVLAGIGLALKVTAGMVPVLVLLTLWVAARIRSDESLVALATLAAATGLGLLWAPGYLDTVRQFGGFYRGFALVPATRLLLNPTVVWLLFLAPILLLISWRVMRFRLGVMVWLVAGSGFVISVLAQGKGFPYHFFPANWSAASATLIMLASTARRAGRLDALRRAMAGAVLIIMLSPAVYVGWLRINANPQSTFDRASFNMLRGTPVGTTVAMHSSRLGDGFPLANVRRLTLTGRFPTLWFLYPYDSSATGWRVHVVPYADSALTPVERELRHDVAEDLAGQQPALLLVRDPGRDRVVLRYLCDDPLYRRAARKYQLVQADSVMQLFKRDTSMQGDGACASS
jgi:hypothetical protein